MCITKKDKNRKVIDSVINIFSKPRICRIVIKARGIYYVTAKKLNKTIAWLLHKIVIHIFKGMLAMVNKDNLKGIHSNKRVNIDC